MRNLKRRSSKLTADLVTSAIGLYQLTVSPDHGIFRTVFVKAHCRFYPSCSEYVRQSVRQYGLSKGLVLSLKRIFRCNPWSIGGYDPAAVLNRK